MIGDENCSKKTKGSYCNGPLLPGIEYGLMARIFTENTFRDTSPIFFRIKHENIPQMSPIVMAASSLGFLIFLSIFVCLFCCCSMRRQKKLKKKKEAAETVDNLLSFTSYCVIDKSPARRGQFDHLL